MPPRMKREAGLIVEDRRLQISAESVENCLQQLDQAEPFIVTPGSIAVAFVTPEGSAQLHRDFFDDPEPTDVMTFPGDPEDNHAGDIAICPQIAAESARRESLPFDTELTLYLVHAWLHLAGLDDQDAEDRRRMRQAENRLMQLLQTSGACLEARWIP